MYKYFQIIFQKLSIYHLKICIHHILFEYIVFYINIVKLFFKNAYIYSLVVRQDYILFASALLEIYFEEINFIKK